MYPLRLRALERCRVSSKSPSRAWDQDWEVAGGTEDKIISLTRGSWSASRQINDFLPLWPPPNIWLHAIETTQIQKPNSTNCNWSLEVEKYFDFLAGGMTNGQIRVFNTATGAMTILENEDILQDRWSRKVSLQVFGILLKSSSISSACLFLAFDANLWVRPPHLQWWPQRILQDIWGYGIMRQGRA